MMQANAGTPQCGSSLFSRRANRVTVCLRSPTLLVQMGDDIWRVGHTLRKKRRHHFGRVGAAGVIRLRRNCTSPCGSSVPTRSVFRSSRMTTQSKPQSSTSSRGRGSNGCPSRQGRWCGRLRHVLDRRTRSACGTTAADRNGSAGGCPRRRPSNAGKKPQSWQRVLPSAARRPRQPGRLLSSD